MNLEKILNLWTWKLQLFESCFFSKISKYFAAFQLALLSSYLDFLANFTHFYSLEPSAALMSFHLVCRLGIYEIKFHFKIKMKHYESKTHLTWQRIKTCSCFGASFILIPIPCNQQGSSQMCSLQLLHLGLNTVRTLNEINCMLCKFSMPN